MTDPLAAAADYLDGEFTEIRRAQGKTFEWLCGIADAEGAIRDLATGTSADKSTDPLTAAQEAHSAALAAQEAMRHAAHERDEAVKAARAAGVSAAELAEALGVNRHRIHAMLKKDGDK